MSVLLPTSPQPAKLTRRPVSYGNDLTPPLGGDVQRLVRLGDRWAMDAEMPAMTEADADLWEAALLLGLSDSVVLNIPLPKAGVGSPGAPLVNGAGQAGLTLAVKGLAASYPIKVGQWLSLVVSGRRYLHRATAAVAATSGGLATVSIWPMLRVSPANGDTVEIAQPKIEGLIPRDQISAMLDLGHIATGLKFTLTEQK
jgi:hypothetical protein